ncbi:MAG TPA: 50S ribosomal protein L11 methyltransferase [Oxalicibacterium sp.]|nr:50S ribosomal protein L11 methyltransferase [Oxalicibacterium sp.]
MSWTEIVVEVARNHAEALSDALIDAGALSVSVEDADFGTDAEQPLFGEPGMEPTETAWEHSRVVALSAEDSDQAAMVKEAAQAVGLDAATLAYTLRPVAEQDWVRLTQSQFEPMHIGRNIWVVPSWHDAPDPQALVLELDPGLAFGTGSHPTTRLCMEWLEAHPPVGATVLDYGCGSGILAMVASKLGAADVIGVDIDRQAIESAQFNAVRNHCDIAYYLPDDFATVDHTHAFDVVVANILANPLKLMAPMLSGRVKSGGHLILSGVLATQADEVIAAYSPFLPLAVWAEREGWVALAGTLPSSSASPILR